MPRKTSLPVADAAPDLWYKDGLSFTCTQCGNCCTGGPGYVWVSDIEIDRLADHFKLDRETTLKKYCRTIRGRVSLKEKRDVDGQYPCIFLTEYRGRDQAGRLVMRRGCSIYPVRPLQCRTWPFWDGNLQDRDAWKQNTKKCPGSDDGKRYSLDEIEALRDAEDWPELAKTPSSTEEGEG